MQTLTALLKAQTILQNGASLLQEDNQPPACVTSVMFKQPYIGYLTKLSLCSDTFEVDPNSSAESGLLGMCNADQSKVNECIGAVSGLVRSGFVQELMTSCADESNVDPSLYLTVFDAMSCVGDYMQDVLTTSRDALCARNSADELCFGTLGQQLPQLGAQFPTQLGLATDFASGMCSECNRQLIKGGVAVFQATEQFMQCVDSSDNSAPPFAIPSGVNMTQLRKLALTVDNVCDKGCIDTFARHANGTDNPFEIIRRACDNPCIIDSFQAVAKLSGMEPPASIPLAVELMCQKDMNNTRCIDYQETLGAPENSCCAVNEQLLGVLPSNRSAFGTSCTPLYTTAKRVAGRLVLHNIALSYVESRVDELRQLLSTAFKAPAADLTLKVQEQHGLVTIVFELRAYNDATARRYAQALEKLPEVETFAQLAPSSARVDSSAAASLDVSKSAAAECTSDEDCQKAQTVPEDVPGASSIPAMAMSAALALAAVHIGLA
ncbi:MAG: hypothetical protein MHM6MM_008412 [Cercozoa sp. M6MM]